MSKRLFTHLLPIPLVFSFGCGVPVVDREPLLEAAPEVTVTVTEAAPRVTVTATPKGARSTAKPAAMIEDGTWIVGEDIPVGQYRVTRNITENLCYWKISRLGSNGDDIISNELGPKGRPLVTLRRGQEFTTARCGVWAKR